MNNFKQRLKVSNRRNIDEIICNAIILEMKTLCETMKKREDSRLGEKCEHIEEQMKIKQIENRIKGISKIFINYQRNIDNIRAKELRDKLFKIESNHELNDIDRELQKIVEKTGKKICKRIRKEEVKSQVTERTEGIKELLENFDEDMYYIYQLEMQQTKLGSLIFEEEKITG